MGHNPPKFCKGNEAPWYNPASTIEIGGPPGKRGDPGKVGPRGPQGDDGEDGDDGLSAYELAVQEGFSGSLNDWLASLQGPPGVSNDGSYPAVSFNYGDASSVILVLTSSAPSEIMLVSLQIEQAFNGLGAQLMLGTLADPDLIMSATDNAPSVVATFEVSPRVELPAGTEVFLTIVPGTSASQGAGQIVLQATTTS